MDTSVRPPLQGVKNIIRFNWHYYALSAAVVVLLLAISFNFDAFAVAAHILVLLIICTTMVSLAISAYIYDFSDLYKLTWLAYLSNTHPELIINIHAGFDDTSQLLANKFSSSELLVADFYDPARHTEVSIKRARQRYPPFPNTRPVNTSHLPIATDSADHVFVLLSAHEIRQQAERIAFLKELYRVLKPAGQVVVTEHLRDLPNFLAYNIGAFHFHSKRTWLTSFRLSGFDVTYKIKTTPFITTFILEKNGTAS